MLDGIREAMNTPTGKKVSAVVGGVLLLVVAFVLYRQLFAGNEAEQAANTRWFVDASTGKAYRVSVADHMTIPAAAPSGDKTGYPAEECYWNADGTIKKSPTYVLVKSVWGLGDGPTFCPDCGRLVVGHNPHPRPGMKPPPTKEEYESRAGR